MAFVTRRRVFSRIDDEFAAPTASRRMQTPWPVARFAPRLTRRPNVFQTDPRMRAGGKDPRNVRVAFRAGLIAHETRSRDLRRGRESNPVRRTRRHQKTGKGARPKSGQNDGWPA